MYIRNPNNPKETLYRHFYLPDLGDYGVTELGKYDQAREATDEFLSQVHDQSYALKPVFAKNFIISRIG